MQSAKEGRGGKEKRGTKGIKKKGSRGLAELKWFDEQIKKRRHEYPNPPTRLGGKDGVGEKNPTIYQGPTREWCICGSKTRNNTEIYKSANFKEKYGNVGELSDLGKECAGSNVKLRHRYVSLTETVRYGKKIQEMPNSREKRVHGKNEAWGEGIYILDNARQHVQEGTEKVNASQIIIARIH